MSRVLETPRPTEDRDAEKSETPRDRLVSQQAPSLVVARVAAWPRAPTENRDDNWQGSNPLAQNGHVRTLSVRKDLSQPRAPQGIVGGLPGYMQT